MVSSTAWLPRFPRAPTSSSRVDGVGSPYHVVSRKTVSPINRTSPATEAPTDHAR